jgi:hypothetical protein
MDVGRPATEGLNHTLYRCARNARERAPPSGMRQTHSAPHRIVEQDRHTVCKAQHQVYPGLVRHQSIGSLFDLATVHAADHTHDRAVNLVRRNDL